MGLDMYLVGEVWVSHNDKEAGLFAVIDGYPVQRHELDLGSWRKHRHLHGYIVTTFAEGVDMCQKIELSAENCRQIAKALRAEDLPHTEGFFFGNESRDEVDRLEKEAHAVTFEKAADWKDSKGKKDWKHSIHYQASW